MHRTHALQQDMLISLPARRGAVLALESGAIWLTMDGRDIVLADGQTLRLEKDATLLIQAFSSTRLRLVPPAAHSFIKALKGVAERFVSKRFSRKPATIRQAA